MVVRGMRLLKGGNMDALLLWSHIHKDLRLKSSSADSHVPMDLQIRHLDLAHCRGTSWRVSIQVGTRSQTFPNLARHLALCFLFEEIPPFGEEEAACVYVCIWCFRRNHTIYQPCPGEQIIFCKVCKFCV